MELVAGCYEQVLLGFATRPGQVTGEREWGQGRSTESRNGLVGRGLRGHLFPASCHGQGHRPRDQRVQSPIQPGLERLQRSLWGKCPARPCGSAPHTHRLALPQPRFRAPPGLLKRVAGAGRPLPRPLPPGSAPSLPRRAPGSDGVSGLRAATWVRRAAVRGRSTRGGAEDGWDVGWGQVEGVSPACRDGKRENPPLLPLGFISVQRHFRLSAALITRGGLHA